MKYGYTCLLMNNDDQTDTTLVTLARLSIYRCVYLTSTIKSAANFPVHLSWSVSGSSKARCTISILRCDERRAKVFFRIARRVFDAQCTAHRCRACTVQNCTRAVMCARRVESDAHRSSLVAEVELGSTFRDETCDGGAIQNFAEKHFDSIARRSSRRISNIVHRALAS